MLASAWMGADLADFRQPQIILSDPKTGTSLCEYTLEVSRRLLHVSNICKDSKLPQRLIPKAFWHFKLCG